MASLKFIEARKAEAQKQTADGIAEVNRKLDLIMAKLGIEDAPAVIAEAPAVIAEAPAVIAEAPAETEAKPKGKSK